MIENPEIHKIETMIYVIRDQRVMLDSDLSELYGVTTSNLNKAVKRNERRFPDDFMFQLSDSEFNDLKVKLGVKGKYGGVRKNPKVFTENGVAMLSGVLNSERAIYVNIAIMRIFTKLRSFLFLEKDLSNQVENLEENTAQLFKVVFERLDEVESLITPNLSQNRKKIGIKKK